MAKYARLRERVAAVAARPPRRPAGRDRRGARPRPRPRLHRRRRRPARLDERRRSGASASRGPRRWSSGRAARPARRSPRAGARWPRAAASTSPAAPTTRTATPARASACSTTPRWPPASMQAEGRVRRVVVIDLDVHQGDGTAAIFAGDASVFTFSLHGRRNFPFRKEVADLDVELADGTGDGAYLATLATALPRALEPRAGGPGDLPRRRRSLRRRPPRPAGAEQAGPRRARSPGPRRARGARPAGRDRHGRRLRRVDRRHRRHPRDDGRRWRSQRHGPEPTRSRGRSRVCAAFAAHAAGGDPRRAC